MNADIIPFPRRDALAWAVRVVIDPQTGAWFVVHGDFGWLYASLNEAVSQGMALADDWGVPVLLPARTHQSC
jgi:hypothetical protein